METLATRVFSFEVIFTLQRISGSSLRIPKLRCVLQKSVRAAYRQSMLR
ncbi:hypothetical protein ACVMB1_006108 [Bradyrhizobium sp. USDA 4504]